jgi:hypothetical protein
VHADDLTHPAPSSRLVGVAHCSHLRHKGMYVLSTPDPGELEHAGRYDATAYWCLCTMKAIGPDGQPAHADRCRAGNGRSCCDD